MKHLSRIVLALAVVCFAGVALHADVKTQQLELKAGDVAVTVRNHDGREFANAGAKLLNSADKEVATMAADAKGKGVLKDLKPGDYKLVVADRAIVNFTVSDKAKVTKVLIVLPAPPRYAAGAEKKAIAMPTLLTFIIGTAAIVGLGFLIFDGGGSHGHP